jgi:hypothetical protein
VVYYGDSAATPPGAVEVSGRAGKFAAARNARIMHFALRLYF